MGDKSKRFVAVTGEGRKWADIYDTTLSGGKNAPGKKVAQASAELANDIVDDLNDRAK